MVESGLDVMRGDIIEGVREDARGYELESIRNRSVRMCDCVHMKDDDYRMMIIPSLRLGTGTV